MKYLFSILILVLFWTFSSPAQEFKLLTPDVIDFGEVSEGEILRGEIKFQNAGNKPIEIADLKSSCGCTVPELQKNVYAPGESGQIDFTVRTKGFQGITRKAITIFFTGGKMDPKRVLVQANVIPLVKIHPTYFNFVQVPVDPDTVIMEFLEFENNSDRDVHIENAFATDDYIAIMPNSATIPAKKSQLFQIHFKPLKTGRHNTSIILKSDYENRPELHVPVFIEVVQQN